MKKLFTLIACALIPAMSIMAQERVIQGNVTSRTDGLTVPGVTVSVPGTTLVAVTDIDGHYTISVPEETKMLRFSSLGLKTQDVEIGSSGTIDVILETDELKLDEVVITANAIEREKRSLGYGVTTVSGDDLTKGEERSLVNSLQGKVPGVQITSTSGGVGSSSRIVIRGGSSILLSNKPLMVVDGIPIQDKEFQTGDELNRQVDAGNRANDINPEDIESISILKGPAAAALYGSRASNGAVMITTKSGKAAAGAGKNLAMSVSSGYTFESPLKLPEFQNQFGQGLPFLPHDLRENTSWGAEFDGVVRPWGNPVDGEQRVKPYSALEDNVKEFFDIGHTLTNNVSLAGGKDKTNYYFSAGNVNQSGIIPGTHYNRTTFKVSAGTELANNFTSSVSVIYAKSKGDLTIQGQNTYLSPWENVLQTPRDISLLELRDYHNKFNDLNNYYSPYTTNPWYTLNENSYKNNVDHIISNAQLGYRLNSWIDLNYRIGIDYYSDRREEIQAIQTIDDPLSVRALNGTADFPGFYQLTSLIGQEINSDIMATFHRDLSENLKASLLLGHGVTMQKNTSQISTANNLTIPFFYNLSNVNGTPSTANTLEQRRLWGLYADLNLNWKNYLFLELTARNDHTSTLSPDNNSYWYPSASLSLVFTDAFDLRSKTFSFGKIAVNYARVGKDAPAYVIEEIYAQPSVDNPVYTITDGHQNVSINFPFNGIPGFTKGNTLSNPDLTPEFTKAFEVNIDLGFLDDRLGLTANIYSNKSEDQIIPIQLPASTGFRAQYVNAATLTNKGIELLLRVTPVLTPSFKWSFSINYTKNTNNVEELYQGLNQLSIGAGTTFVGADLVAQVGKPYGQLLVTSLLHDAEGRVVVDPVNGLPVQDPNDQIVGSILPDWIGGITNTFSYKSFSFSFTFDTHQGGLLYSRTKSLMLFTGTDPLTVYNNREPFVVPNSIIQNPDGSYSPNNIAVDPFTYFANSGNAIANVPSESVIDASFIKLREINLSYTLPKKWSSKTPFGEITVSAFGRNLWIKTDKDNYYIDPEISSFGTGNVQGYDYGALPSVKSFGGLVRVSF